MSRKQGGLSRPHRYQGALKSTQTQDEGTEKYRLRKHLDLAEVDA